MARPTAVVPRSHRLPETPEQTIAQSFRGGGQLDGELSHGLRDHSDAAWYISFVILHTKYTKLVASE